MEQILDRAPLTYGKFIGSARSDEFIEIFIAYTDKYKFDKNDFKTIERVLYTRLKRKLKLPIITVEASRTNTTSRVGIQLFKKMDKCMSLYQVRCKSKEENSEERQWLKIIDETCEKFFKNYQKDLEIF